MTIQEMFDAIYLHFSEPGACLAKENGQCMYRMTKADGTVCKCAVGCLISDDEYTWEMEGTLVTPFRVSEELRERLIGCDGLQDGLFLDYDNPRVEFLSEMQRMHDNSTTLTVKDFLIAMRLYAAQHDLTVPMTAWVYSGDDEMEA